MIWAKKFSTMFIAANWLAFIVVIALLLYTEGPSSRNQPAWHENNAKRERRVEIKSCPTLASTTKPLGDATPKVEPNKHRRANLGKVDSKDYDVMEQPDCWRRGCGVENNLPAYSGCTSEANRWLKNGVDTMDSMMREYQHYVDPSTSSAIASFREALKLDPNCNRAHENIALVLIFTGKHEEALKELEQSQTAKSWVFRGLAKEWLGKEAKPSYEKAAELDAKIRDEYHGIMLSPQHDTNRKYSMMSYSSKLELPAITKQLLWSEFGSKSFADYGILPPKQVRKNFLAERYIVIPRFVPPFVLNETQHCYHELISGKILKLGDPQSLRYTAYNSRCMSFLHRAYTDLVRKIVSHNARPSYTYFGGYVPGAELIPHTDRAQCEFTLSWTIENYPIHEAWPLGLDPIPEWTGRQDDYPGRNGLKWPPTRRRRWVRLLAGDALLFMGRRHNHFREGKLRKGAWLNQVFMHYVPERFDRKLG